MCSRLPASCIVIAILSALTALEPAGAADEAARLVAAMLGQTPLVDDLRQLTDTIGGRPTGSEANERAVEWALANFAAAGVEVRAEPFEMPQRWLEVSASALVEGDGIRFTPRVAARPFSTATPAGGVSAPLVDAGSGSE